MKSSHLSLNFHSRWLLILLMAAHMVGTIVAYTFYVKVSSLGDGYAPKDFAAHIEMYNITYGNLRDLSSALVVHGIYTYIGAFLPGLFAPMALGLVVAIATWHAFRDVYMHVNRQLFWACNLFPHFLIWSGSSSKEQIMLIFGTFLIGFAAKRSFAANRLNITSMFFVFLSLGAIFWVRPNYFLIYFTIIVTSLFAPTLLKTRIYKFSTGIWAFVFIVITFGAIFFASFFTLFFSKDVIIFMERVEASFLGYKAGSNRTDIQWNSVSDFIYNSMWGIPQGFIGPTLVEAISKPIQFPVFLEGVFYLVLLSYLFMRLFKLAGASKLLRVHILPYYFVAMVIIFVSYPYLIFNAGSALRYKQSMHPVLFFYPLLILAYAKANKLIRNKL